MSPPDKILGLNDEFMKNPSRLKVNLGIGVYRDANGMPLVLRSVREARARIAANHPGHEYLDAAGHAVFLTNSLTFAYGAGAEVLNTGRVAAIQTLSGTGACRLAGEFIARFVGPGTRIYLPDPTWANHLPIMASAGLHVVRYRYFHPAGRSFDYDGMMADVLAAPNGSVWLLHACAHNPTGCDPTHPQWDALSRAFASKDHIVFFDSAYQGFATGDPEEDAYAIRQFVADGNQILLGQSYAKNFGLYGERVGALSVVCQDRAQAETVLSQLKHLVRQMYSSPPVYGARIVAEILSDPALKEQWRGEVKAMADRVRSMRGALRGALEGLGSTVPWGHLTDQIGMFAYTGLTEGQVLRMRQEHSVYCMDDGRLSVAGLNGGNVGVVAAAIHAVTATATAAPAIATGTAASATAATGTAATATAATGTAATATAGTDATAAVGTAAAATDADRATGIETAPGTATGTVTAVAVTAA
jgi:aspartate aminotransferase